MPLAPSTRLGPYEILALVGAGGMGEVYRARDTRLGRDVALKILPAEVAGDVSQRHRFEREARAVASLNHPNIVAVFDVGTEGGISYIICELVDGERLCGAKFGLRKKLDIALQIMGGLAAAHDAGIVHRDLKPDNILVTRDGRAKILDFGLAKVRAAQIDAAAATETLTVRTEPGAVMGTVGYMSPEQVRGLPVNYRSDIFSFGVVLYEMVTGERPFTGSSSMAICDAILHHQPRGFGDSLVPGKLKGIILKLLEKDPANRYGSADEVQQELKVVEASLAPAGPVGLSRNAWIAIGAAAILACVLAGWLWRRSSRERWALQTATPEIARLVDAGEYVKAAALTREARSLLPKDPTLERLWMRATGEVSIASVPSGADVSIRPYRGDPNAWETLGKTPLQKVRVPRDAYVWRLVKPGFATAFFIGEPPARASTWFPIPAFDWTWKLRPEGQRSTRDGCRHRWTGSASRTLSHARPAAQVDDFLIDRHEVTNEEYKKFVDAGGYQKREFWKQPFVKGGRTVPWEEAVALFHDATGRPGPATWEVGELSQGAREISGRRSQLVRGGGVRGVRWQEPSHGIPLDASVAIRRFYTLDHCRK